MRYFARLTNNKEYILLYTNLILSDSRKKDSNSYISTLFDLFKDLAAIPLSHVFVINTESLVFSFVKKDADEKNYSWTDLIEEILLIFRMHIDKQELGDEFVEEPQLENEISLSNNKDAVFEFDLSQYKLEHEITDYVEQGEVIIRHHFSEGKIRGATHLFVVDDIKQETFYCVFVYPNEDPLYQYYFFNANDDAEIVEVYFLYMPFDGQTFQKNEDDYDDDEDDYDEDEDDYDEDEE